MVGAPLKSIPLLIVILLVVVQIEAKHRRQVVKYPTTSNATHTRTLSGTYATDGNNATNWEVYNLITLTLLRGFVKFQVKGYNDRVYLEKFRRSYWFGDRYYYMDNLYYLATRDTCAYKMDYDMRKDISYTDGSPVYDIVYQCQRYVEYCCGLDCCRNYGLLISPRPPHQQQYPWSLSPSIHSLLAPLLTTLIRA
ncbi:hypothetical protein PMAYCL1PPCAC_30831 [Pristionchus mayeri]|uniref:CX domain-containing protein n=1 Tax=Pristionchus mayeri TaxID=1317129 RepID=A0AAN5DBW8_9BILA|nr:hypothetical protein PMAYCL1PPCAC_30831 [Pristionchus mayeri]